MYVHDSGTGQDLKHKVFAVSYEPFWQKIRTAGSFKTVDDANKTIAEVRHYVMVSSDAYNKQCRVWRASNYMNAVPIGQPTPNGLMRVPRDAEDIIVTFRNEMKQLMKEVEKPEVWDWDTTRQVLQQMSKSPILVEWLAKHRHVLMLTRANPSRKQAKPELHYYLNLVSEVLP